MALRKQAAAAAAAPDHPNSNVNVNLIMKPITDNWTIPWGRRDRYELVSWIREGTFSQVFEALDTDLNRKCVLKVFQPRCAEDELRIQREIKIVRSLRGGTNVILFEDAVKWGIVFESGFSHGLQHLSDTKDFPHYLYELLKALEYTHGKGIMHRDIQPRNVVINLRQKTLRLTDFGRAEHYYPGQPYDFQDGDQYYKAPELLLRIRNSDYSVDLWGVGCILASMLFNKAPFFKGKENDRVDQFVAVVQVLGTEKLLKFMNKYNLTVGQATWSRLKGHSGQTWASFIKNTHPKEEHNQKEAFDLLDKLLCYDYGERLTAVEAMAHPYFEEMAKLDQQQSESRSLNTFKKMKTSHPTLLVNDKCEIKTVIKKEI